MTTNQAMPGQVSIAVDDAARLVRLRLAGDVTGEQYLAALVSVFTPAPWLHDYDFLFDAGDYSGRIGADELLTLGQGYAAMLRALPRVRFGIIASPDSGFRLWPPLLETLFPNRRFHYAADLAHAEALLARLRRDHPAPAVLGPGAALPCRPVEG